jgi:hypothetical protein
MKLDDNDMSEAKEELLDELYEKYGGYPNSIESAIDRYITILSKRGQ